MRPAAFQIVAEFDECQFDRFSDSAALKTILENSINTSGFTLLETHCHEYTSDGMTLVSIISESHVVLHTYPEASHVSVDIFTCAPDTERPLNLLKILKSQFAPSYSREQIIERGDVLELKSQERIYISRSDGIDISMRIPEVLYSGVSEYQRIEVVRSEQFGKMLVLDRHLQLSELAFGLYNASLFKDTDESQIRDKKILVLGGGDGGVTSHILKSNPKSVDIVEADSMVTEVCRKFFPECCVGVFEDKRVNLLSFDVLKFLESCSDYDLIVYDLTLHPESFTQELRPVYLGNIFSIASKKLKPGGKIVMQCCSEFDHPSIKLIEELLKQNFKVFNLHYEYIPSFACRWLFASASN